MNFLITINTIGGSKTGDDLFFGEHLHIGKITSINKVIAPPANTSLSEHDDQDLWTLR